MSQPSLTDLVAVHVSWAGRRDLPLASLGVLVHHDCCVDVLTQEFFLILSNSNNVGNARRQDPRDLIKSGSRSISAVPNCGPKQTPPGQPM